MAKFSEFLPKLRKYEGGYANDPKDLGGETYKGISRKMHPKWSGWSTIDRYKKQSGFPRTAYNDGSLNNLVDTFYKEQFWDKMLADHISSQKLAEQIVDTAINMGIKWGVQFATRMLRMPQAKAMSMQIVNKLNQLHNV